MLDAIKNCRSCNSKNIDVVFELGSQALSGVFRSENLDGIISGPLTLVKCKQCELVQLQHSYPLDEMYNEGYGYRSGATDYMRQHLKGIISFATKNVILEEGDFVLDIGCNDGTLLECYENEKYNRVGIDPVAIKYLDSYNKNI